MHKFFVNKDQISGGILTIIGDDVIHISKVLRLKPDDMIGACDSEGKEYVCAIGSVTKKEVHCKIIEIYDTVTEAPLKITLFQGLPKSTKMDLIIQKCVELGVVEIYPVITERVIVKTFDRDMSSKLERWNRISEEAAKQSNRGIIPRVHAPISFDTALDLMSEFDFNIMPYEKETAVGIKEAALGKTNIKTASIFIGPEGGFEESEVAFCIKNNAIPITLGPRILRTETAGFTTAAILQYELGDMGGVK